MFGLSRKERRTKEILERVDLTLRASRAFAPVDQAQLALRLGVWMEEFQKASAVVPVGPEKDAVFQQGLRELQKQHQSGLDSEDPEGAILIAVSILCECWLYFKSGKLEGGRAAYDQVTDKLHLFIAQALGRG